MLLRYIGFGSVKDRNNLATIKTGFFVNSSQFRHRLNYSAISNLEHSLNAKAQKLSTFESSVCY